MKDKNGVLIKVGHIVKTQQPEGGFFCPTSTATGVVRIVNDGTFDGDLEIELLNLKGRKVRILLDGKINEVLN